MARDQSQTLTPEPEFCVPVTRYAARLNRRRHLFSGPTSDGAYLSSESSKPNAETRADF